MTILNEQLLPNPFKPEQSSPIDNVMAALERELAAAEIATPAIDATLAKIERELIDNCEPLPAFLDRRFLERLNDSVERADPVHLSRGRRIVNLLKMQLHLSP
jgi:hypothetical protein